MSLFTQYMIVNSVFLDTCFEAHTLHMQEPTRFTSQSTARGRPRTNYMDYIQKLTGLKINELAEASEDRETWRELAVTSVDPQPPN